MERRAADLGDLAARRFARPCTGARQADDQRPRKGCIAARAGPGGDSALGRPQGSSVHCAWLAPSTARPGQTLLDRPRASRSCQNPSGPLPDPCTGSLSLATRRPRPSPSRSGPCQAQSCPLGSWKGLERAGGGHYPLRTVGGAGPPRQAKRRGRWVAQAGRPQASCPRGAGYPRRAPLARPRIRRAPCCCAPGPPDGSRAAAGPRGPRRRLSPPLGAVRFFLGSVCRIRQSAAKLELSTVGKV